MRRAAALLLLTAGCTSLEWAPEPQPTDWIAYMARVDALDGPALEAERATTLAALGSGSEAEDRLRTAYLLSRPTLVERDLAASRELLLEIPDESSYAAIRDLMLRELAQEEALAAARHRIVELESQLETLKSIDTELTAGQAELEELEELSK